ncbi:MAG: phosphoglycerate kinase, partial [Candidatus Omnitrophica bacterium]|nr:phosphoglycerate kinase [Candidatus Omnitrophota bacterium]
VNASGEFFADYKAYLAHAKDYIRQNVKPGEIVFLDNLRFWDEENEKDLPGSDDFAKGFASLGDFFVQECYPQAHRPNSTVVNIVKYFKRKAVFGESYLLELKYFNSLRAKLKKEKRGPIMVSLAGVKVEKKPGIISKITVAKMLVEIMRPRDYFKLGGALAYTFIVARYVMGKNKRAVRLAKSEEELVKLAEEVTEAQIQKLVGNSLAQKELISDALWLLKRAQERGIIVLFPVDHRTTDKLKEGKIVFEGKGLPADANIRVVTGNLQVGQAGVDIGPKTEELYIRAMEKCEIILIAGPDGIIEDERTAIGSIGQVKAMGDLTKRGIETIGCGGETEALVAKAKVKLSHVSTGGGAALEDIEKDGNLPGTVAVRENCPPMREWPTVAITGVDGIEKLREISATLNHAFPGGMVQPAFSTERHDTAVNGKDDTRQACLDIYPCAGGFNVRIPQAREEDLSKLPYEYMEVPVIVTKENIPESLRAEFDKTKKTEKEVTQVVIKYLTEQFNASPIDVVSEKELRSHKLKELKTDSRSLGPVVFNAITAIAEIGPTGDLLIQVHFWVRHKYMAAISEWNEEARKSSPEVKVAIASDWYRRLNPDKPLEALSRYGFMFLAEFRSGNFSRANLLAQLIDGIDVKELINPEGIIYDRDLGVAASSLDEQAEIPGFGPHQKAFLASQNSIQQLVHDLYVYVATFFDDERKCSVAVENRRLQDALIGFYYRLSRYLDYLAYQEQLKDVAFFETLRIEIGRYAQRLNQAIRHEDALEVNGSDCSSLINFLNAKPDVRLSFGEQRGLQSLYKEYAPEGGKWANDILEIAEYLTLHNFVAAFRQVKVDNPWLVKPSDNLNVVEDGSGRIATMALSLLSSGDYNAGEPGHESFYCVRTQALKGDTAKDKFAVALNKVKEMFSDIVIGGSGLSLNINNQEIPLSDLIADGRLNFVTDKKPCCAKQDMGVTMPVESVYPVYIRLGRKIIGTVFVIDVAQFIQGLKDSGVKQDNYPRPFIVNYHGRDIYFCLMIDATPGGVEMGDGVVEPIGQEEAKKAKADKKYKPKFKLSAPTVWQMAAISRLRESAKEELGGPKEELARLREILKQIEEKRLNGQGIWWLYLKAQICSKLLLPLSGGIHFMGRYLHKVPLIKEAGAMYATPTSCSTNGASYVSHKLSALFGFGRRICALLGTTLHMYTSDGQKGPFGHLCARSTGAAEGVKQNLDIIALFTALRIPVAMVDARVVVMGGSVFDFIFQTPYPVPKEVFADYLVRVGQEFPDELKVFTKADAREGVYRWKDTISGQRTGSIVYLDTLAQISPNTFRILVAYDNEMSFSYKMHEFIEALFLARQRQKHKRRRAQARREEAARFATPRGQFEAAKNIRDFQPELAASHEQMGNTLLRINKYLSKRGRIHVSPKDFALAEIDNDNRVRWRIALPELRRIITEEPKGPRLTLAAAENVIRYIEKILSPVEEEAHFEREGLSAVEGVVKEPPCSSVQEAFARAQKGAPEPPGYWTKAMVACNSRGRSLGVIDSGDTVKVFDHRADRIRALAKVLVDTLFNKFRTKKDLKVNFVPLTPYDPELFRELGIEPVFSDEELYEDVTNTATDVWEGAGKTIAFIAETEKFTHVTYYFWGGKDRKLKYGYTVMVPSNSIQDHSKKPQMKAKEITDIALDCAYGRNGMKKADVIVMNYANMDILKHTGNHKAMVKAAETIDRNLGRILPAVDEMGGFAIITADHGAGEETKELDERGNFILHPKTGKSIPAVCHSYGTKVPFIVYGFGKRGEVPFNLRDGGSVANVIPTMLELQGILKPREMVESLLQATGKLPAKTGPAMLIIRDGYGIRKFDTPDARACDATLEARTPVDDMLRRDYPNTALLSHGEAVGLPEDYMGDSDVCHKIIGAGRLIEAPISRINKSIKSGEYFRREQNVGPVRKARDAGKSVVLVGLVSEGGVHSHFNTLLADLELCRREGV